MNEDLICGLDATQIEELKQDKGALVLVSVNFWRKCPSGYF